MSLRLMEVVLPDDQLAFAGQLLEKQPVIALWHTKAHSDFTCLRILLAQEQAEPLSDLLSQHFLQLTGFRLVLMGVEATLPNVEAEPDSRQKPWFTRVSREEIYADIAAGSRITGVYVLTVILSALVAAIGLIRSDLAVIIGAMVIAPLLTPQVALSLAAALGDLSLAARAAKTSGLGLIAALGVAFGLGLVLEVDPSSPEIAARSGANLAHLALALASGSAGALAFTAGIPAALTGVMVAVALLPPLVTAGMLAGAGILKGASGALLLYLANVACVNLAGVLTFLIQGLGPRSFWKRQKAQQTARLAIGFWLLLLLALVLFIFLSAER